MEKLAFWQKNEKFHLHFFSRLLHQAALWDNAELLEDLLNGDEIKCLNSRDSWGRTALHAAATNAGSRFVLHHSVEISRFLYH